MARRAAIDWRARHTPSSGTINASLTALSVAAIGAQTGMAPGWALGASGAGALGSAVAGSASDQPLAKPSIALRTTAWLSGGAWTSWALTQRDVWDWGVIGPLVAAALGFGAAAGTLASMKRREMARREEIKISLGRVKLAAEWIARIERVAHIKGCEIPNIEPWKDEHGVETGTGYDLEIVFPEGGHTWRDLLSVSDNLAADADLPEGCGIEVTHGASRGRAILKVSTANALLTEIPIPHDASELSFEEDFDIGVLRDGGLFMINIREFSAMLAGAKRTGKTNQLLAIITRLLRMANLRVWVIDFNGGGVALQWLRAWDDLGRPGRPPIDWVASDPREAEQMAKAAVRIAKARKVEYTRLMAEKDTDLLPMTPDIPGIVIITDEGAEVYANPKHQRVAEPMKEVLRIAGASGVNQINCFLRATADTTGDSLIKSQSRALIGMRMADEAEIAFLLGWKCGVKPEDMPERGYGAGTMDPSGPSSVFRGYRVKPSDINWFVENTVCYRQNESLDPVSMRAAGDIYETRWSADRVSYIFDGAGAKKVQEMEAEAQVEEVQAEGRNEWENAAPVKGSDGLKAAIEANEAGKGERTLDPFEQVLADAGVDPSSDPSTWPLHVREQAAAASTDDTDDEATSDVLKDMMFGLIKAQTPSGGVTAQEIRQGLIDVYGEDQVPVIQTITRWLREDDRVYKPTGYKKYAVRPELMGD